MKKIIVFTVFFILLFSVEAQKIILEQKPFEYKDFLQHKKHFYMSIPFSISFAMPMNNAKEYTLNYFYSTMYSFGLEYKLDFAKFLGWGFTFRFKHQQYIFSESFIYIKKSDEQVKESIRTAGINSGIFFRIYFSKYHGMNGGKYLDFLAFGTYNLWRIYKLEIHKNYGFSTFSIQRFSRVKFISPYNYGIGIRLGSGNISFISEYRLNSMFTLSNIQWNGSYNSPTKGLIPFSLGIQYSF